MQPTTQDIECDILVLGGGLGGCAAAIRAARQGHKVCLTEANPWLGGQLTAQGVSALDEHQYIEHAGTTALYSELREQIRNRYRERYQLSDKALAAPFFNPGDNWGNHLCCEPRAALAALLSMLLPQIEAGRLQIFYYAHLLSAELTGTSINTVTVAQPDFTRQLRFHAAYYLDATELGDLLPLLESPGAHDTPSQQTDGPHPTAHLTFSYPFAVDFRPNEKHTIPTPPDYAYNREHQPYTPSMHYGEHEQSNTLFTPVEGLPGPLWTYRRILAAEQFAPGQVAGDVSLVHWAGTTLGKGNLIDADPETRIALLQRAKNLSLGLLYWLQTEAPRDDGQGCGYPELRLRPDIMGTSDGLSQTPYTCQSRHIIALRPLDEQSLRGSSDTDPRAAFFADSIGIGHHPSDKHGNTTPLTALSTKAFQIPLSALIPTTIDNMLPACKNLGISHSLSGLLRPHPIEWNLGEAAATLASFCLKNNAKPQTVVTNETLLQTFQIQLLQQGVPIHWYTDLPTDHPAFASAQLLAIKNLWPGEANHLHFNPDQLLSDDEVNKHLQIAEINADGTPPLSRGELARLIAGQRFGLNAQWELPGG